jgi:hypothetical protein
LPLFLHKRCNFLRLAYVTVLKRAAERSKAMKTKILFASVVLLSLAPMAAEARGFWGVVLFGYGY